MRGQQPLPRIRAVQKKPLAAKVVFPQQKHVNPGVLRMLSGYIQQYFLGIEPILLLVAGCDKQVAETHSCIFLLSTILRHYW